MGSRQYSDDPEVQAWASQQPDDTPVERAALRAVASLCRFGESRHINKNENVICGRSTATRYVGAMRAFGKALQNCKDQFDVKVRVGQINAEQASRVLESMSSDHRQKSLNVSTKIAEMHLRNLTQDNTIRLERIKSEVPTIVQSRALTDSQTRLLMQNASPRLALSIEISRSCGLRAEGLYTIRQLHEQPPTERRYPEGTYNAPKGYVTYTVIEKGGLCRPVHMRQELANRLEACRREEPVRVYDRGVSIKSYYNLIGGNSFSSSVTRLSNEVLGYSNGAHAFRHSYAQQRMVELQNSGLTERGAKLVLSKELGHFRASIVDYYLR